MPEDRNGANAPPPQTEGAADESIAYEEPSKALAPAAVEVSEPPSAAPAPVTRHDGGGGSQMPPAPPDGGGDEDDGMLRMSFMEHLEELRSRLIRCVLGVLVAFALSLVFAQQLWTVVATPAVTALHDLGFQEKLAQIKPMETFTVIYVKLPLLASIFLSSPWIVYQVWAFIAPGLYKRERRWAAPFIIVSAGLFISGGLFAYFIAFRFGLGFLLGLGRDIYIQPMVSVTEYFDLFVNVTLGVGLVFELPVLIFFLTLLRIVSPSFLLRNSRYAILIIVILAAVITPTPDVFNLMLFAVPMVLLFFLGVFASYVLVLHRENRRFPWKALLYWLGVVVFVVSGVVFIAVTKFGYKLLPHWPFIQAP